MMFRKFIRGPGARTLGLLTALLLPALAPGNSAALAQGARTCPSPTALTRGFQGTMAHVRYLADDALEGRETGTRGARCAADYIAGVFRELGLEPVGDGGTYFQTFEVQMGSILGAENRLEIAGQALPLSRAWIPFAFSASEAVTAPLIYGGPGVSMPGREEDRFARLALDGKIVVVEGTHPHGGEMGAGDPHFKATVAQGRGATAVLILLGEEERLPDPTLEERPTLRIPVLAIAGSQADRIREAARETREATLTTTVEPRMVEARNVVGLLRGVDPRLADEVIVVGAHYDHLGFGGGGSLAPDSRAVHNGADDNASGTAAVMGVARRLARASFGPARSVLYVAFTGEEKGLWGSAHYVGDPLMPLENTVAMLNMDMVGRLRENTLTVYGTGTAEEWGRVLEEANADQAKPFVLSAIPDGYGPSDQSSFYGAGVPVLHFFTNTHPEYHRPEDDWDLINAPGMERITDLIADITASVAGTTAADLLALTLVEKAGNPHGAMAAADEDEEARPVSRGYGAYMGTIPDMTPRDFGVRITGVREGSPAEKAGLKGGDVLVRFGDEEITDLYAYTYALRDHRPGDEVEVVVLRDGERMTFTAFLGRRN